MKDRKKSIRKKKIKVPDCPPPTDLRSALYRAREILGAHHADLSPLEQKFFESLRNI